MEPSFVLTCCSTSDHDPSFYKERNLPYVKFHFRLNDKEYDDDLGQTIPFSQFYQAIRDGAMPTTSQPSTMEFAELWEPFLKEGKDILHVTLSSGLSGVLNSANAAKDLLEEKYPDRRILVVDSLGASGGYGLQVDYMADLRDAGKSIDEVYKWELDHRLHIHHWFFSTDLTSYWRGGRISRASAAVGNVLGICPLMNMDTEGHLHPRRNVRSKRRVIEEIVKEMENHVQNGHDYDGKCHIVESDCMKDAEAVRELVVSKFPKLQGKITISSVGTVIGAHTGPGTIALFFMGDMRTE
jgi:DegV family protein with EDD domain